MSLFLILLSLFNHGSVERQQDDSTIRIFVVSQHKFKNRGHHPLHNRRVTFKMVNDSNHRLIVYGRRFDDGFEPTGYIISFDQTTREWSYPNPSNSPITWSERSDGEKEKHVLSPGASITFEAEMSELEVGMRFKRTVYVSLKEGQEPTEIRGEEFVLK